MKNKEVKMKKSFSKSKEKKVFVISCAVSILLLSSGFVLVQAKETATGNESMDIENVRDVSYDSEENNTFYTVFLDGDYFGEYRPGDNVEIEAEEEWSASDYSCGQEFLYWSVIEGNIEIENEWNATLSFTMPAENVKLEAAYAFWDAKPINLTIENGTGDSLCFSGSKVDISADTKEGYEFSSWKVKSGKANIEDIHDEKTIVSFEEGYFGDVLIEASYINAKRNLFSNVIHFLKGLWD